MRRKPTTGFLGTFACLISCAFMVSASVVSLQSKEMRRERKKIEAAHHAGTAMPETKSGY
jgi:hypothetical protein